jgi:uncharacterized protein
MIKQFADYVTFSLMGLSPGQHLAEALNFFIYDTLKIFFLLIVMIYLIGLVRVSLPVERVRAYLAGKHRLIGYVLGSIFGAITPFCSCSSIPVFLGFTSAGIPLGMTMAFLLTSPLINEIAVILLLSLVGWKITLLYVLIGLGVGIVGGLFLDAIKAERMLQGFARKVYEEGQHAQIEAAEKKRITMKDRHQFAKRELTEVFGRIWIWVIVGVGVGAALHGFVPDTWFEAHLGSGQWWSVPLATVIGIPLYSNATAIIPIMESLIVKGLPLGTTLAFCMSTVAASFPEFVMLKQVMQWRLLAIVFLMLLIAFTIVGWVLNAIY